MKIIILLLTVSIFFALSSCSSINSPILNKHAVRMTEKISGQPYTQNKIKFLRHSGIERKLKRYHMASLNLPDLESVMESHFVIGVFLKDAIPSKNGGLNDALFVPINCLMVDPPESCTSNGYLFQIPNGNEAAEEPYCFDCTCLGGDGTCYCYQTSPPCGGITCGDCRTENSRD